MLQDGGWVRGCLFDAFQVIRRTRAVLLVQSWCCIQDWLLQLLTLQLLLVITLIHETDGRDFIWPIQTELSLEESAACGSSCGKQRECMHGDFAVQHETCIIDYRFIHYGGLLAIVFVWRKTPVMVIRRAQVVLVYITSYSSMPRRDWSVRARG